MSGATAWKPAAASTGNWCRHEYHDSGKPWHSTTSGPSPCSATCMRMQLVSTNRCFGSLTAASCKTGPHPPAPLEGLWGPLDPHGGSQWWVRDVAISSAQVGIAHRGFLSEGSPAGYTTRSLSAAFRVVER